MSADNSSNEQQKQHILDNFIAQAGLQSIADATKGHKTIATRAFKRGDTILSIHPLFSLPVRKNEDRDDDTPSDQQNKQQQETQPQDRCTHCFKTLPPKRRPRCSQCHTALYCSTRCLTDHWNARHYFECDPKNAENEAALEKAEAKIKPVYRPYLRMAAGVTRVLQNIKKQQQQQVPEWLRVQALAWDRLISHRSEHPKYLLKQYAEIANLIPQTPGSLVFLDPVDALCRFGCNNFAAFDDSGDQNLLQSTGHLCSPLVSLLLNHACLPNASFVYSAGGRQVVRALRDIAEGDEVTLAYIDGLKPRSERRKTLEAVYFFTCHCERCELCGSPRARMDALMDRSPQSDSAAHAIPHNLPTDYAQPPCADPWVTEVTHALLTLLASRSRHTHESKLETQMIDSAEPLDQRDLSFAAYRHWLECQDECLERISTGSADEDAHWHWSYVSALHVLAFYALVYPPFHPLVGRQCLLVAQLAWNSLQGSDSHKVNEKLGLSEGLVRNLAMAAQNVLEASGDLEEVMGGASATEKKIALLLSQIEYA
ncbi:hypothetical protein LPJ66_002633 [Kickxella alabastrina]|uniref:Uncharacterized protein n=1 Tax=Kickxella alabastrina TaxID=61397 RepID=A0ACC1IPY6_9FUNG|nr:hypothetical protein LPJ66_002633 [Kickxella alabastrina]